jgi:prepilin-type N-terminal cleavage/methylation domain-containing protein
MKIKIKRRRCFSLVELMIAMVILAVGILATMAMQFSSLNAYTSAREMTGANDMARTVEQMIRTEARGRRVEQVGAVPEPFANREPLFDAATGGGGNWVRPGGFETPMTARLNPGGSPDDGANRFCVYVAAEEKNDEPGFFRVGIAVVYPSSSGQFPEVDANNPAGVCPGPGDIELDEDQQQDLELRGLRVTRLSTAVRAVDA